MGRYRFDHLVHELSLAAGRDIPRFRLWMRLHHLGWDPEALTLRGVLAFCEAPMHAFLAELGLSLSPRAARRLRRAVRRFDPALVASYERLAEE